jgi:hypothetical protein
MINVSKIIIVLFTIFTIFILFILIKLITSNMTKRSRARIQKIKPIVILLDLDKTLIGDIVPQSEEYYIIKSINNELKNLDKKTISFNFKRLQNELREHIIRPYLLKFLNLARSYNNIEIYIYTASDDKWAKTLIPNIEKAINFRFNRPIFTRNNTIIKNNNFKKSIKNIKPFIYKSIKNKYNLNNQNQLEYIMLFDDTRNVLLEKRLQINVPGYNTLYQIDYLRNIPDRLVKVYYILIEDKLKLKHSTDVNGFYSKYHDFIKRRYLYADANTKKYLNDLYWKKIYKVFKNNIENTSFNKLLSLLRFI